MADKIVPSPGPGGDNSNFPGEELTSVQQRASRFSPQERRAMRAMEAANPKYAPRPGDTLKVSDIPIMGDSPPDDATDLR